MPNQSNLSTTLNLLKAEAWAQRRLSQTEVLPPVLQPMAALIVTHAWQTLLGLALLLAFVSTILGIELHIL